LASGKSLQVAGFAFWGGWRCICGLPSAQPAFRLRSGLHTTCQSSRLQVDLRRSLGSRVRAVPGIRDKHRGVVACVTARLACRMVRRTQGWLHMWAVIQAAPRLHRSWGCSSGWWVGGADHQLRHNAMCRAIGAAYEVNEGKTAAGRLSSAHVASASRLRENMDPSTGIGLLRPGPQQESTIALAGN
jgi:hypothetical protein